MKRLLVILPVLAVLAATSMTAVPAANAGEFYQCKSCAKASGPNEHLGVAGVSYAEGENQSGKGVCSKLWRYNGENNYTLMVKECTSTGTKITVKSSEFTGHGEVERYFSEFLYNLFGIQE